MDFVVFAEKSFLSVNYILVLIVTNGFVLHTREFTKE